MSAPIAAPAPELTARFDPRTGNTGDWMGADSARSVPLGDGRTVWLFADTYKRTSGTGIPTSRSGNTIVSDSIAIQHGDDLATAEVTFHFATTPSGRWFPISSTHYSWPMDAIVIGNDLYVTSIRVQASSPLGGEYGWCIHKIPNAKTLPVTSWVSTLLYQSGDTGTRPVFSPYVQGGYVYAFTIKRFTGWQWNRWTTANFTGTGTQSNVEWYTGAGWSTDNAQAMTISANAETSEGSVYPRAVDGRWMITDSVGEFPQLKGGIRLAAKDANGNYPVAGTGGYSPPPPDFQAGDHVLVGGTYDAVIQSVNSNGTRVVKYTPFWGGAIETRPLADLTRKNSSWRAAYANPRYDAPPLPPDYWTYAYKAHPSLPGNGLVVTFVDNGVLGAPLDIYFPKFYRILPPTITNLTVSRSGVVRWQSGGAPDRVMVRHLENSWVEVDPLASSYTVNGYNAGDTVTVRSIGIGGETVRSTYTDTVLVVPTAKEWQILPREANLTRVGDPVTGWTELKLIERHNEPDTWTVTGPSEVMGAFYPGTGSILYRGNEQVASGKLTNLKRGRITDPRTGASTDTTTASFTSDLLLIGHKTVIPSPSHPMSTTTAFKFPAAYDQRSGPVETLIINFIRAHAGDLAQADRRIARLRTPASQGRGGTTSVSGRFDQLGVLVKDLAEAGNLRVRIEHTEDSVNSGWLDVVIEPVADVSENIRFGTAESTATGIITDWDYEIGMPTVTRALVAGGGELEDRDMLMRRVDEPETLWGISAETLVDQRQVPPLDDYARIGTTVALIQQALDLANRSLAGNQRIREWVAGSTMDRTSQMGWSWMVEWDRLREADLTTELLNKIKTEIEATVAEGNFLVPTMDIIITWWNGAVSNDNEIRTRLDSALKAVWQAPQNELGHAAAIIQATDLIDGRNGATFQSVMDLATLLNNYSSHAQAQWTTRVNEVTTELAKGGDEALDEGVGLVKVQFTPALGPDLEYRRDVRVGDIVGYDLPGLEPAKDKIREATTTVAVAGNVATETVSVVVGTPDAPTNRTQQQTARALRGITVIQRST